MFVEISESLEIISTLTVMLCTEPTANSNQNLAVLCTENSFLFRVNAHFIIYNEDPKIHEVVNIHKKPMTTI